MRLRLLGTGASGGTPGTGRSLRRESSALARDGISILTDVTRDVDVQVGGIDAIDRGAAGPVERIVLTQIGRSAPPHAHLVGRRALPRTVPGFDGMQLDV